MIRRTYQSPTMHCRSGISIPDLVVASVIFLVIPTVAIPTLRLAAQERGSAQRRAIALTEVSNILDRLTVQDWEQLSAESLKQPELSDWALRELNDPKVVVTVNERTEPVAAKQVVVELIWNERPGVRVAPVRLSSWIFYRRGDSS